MELIPNSINFPVSSKEYNGFPAKLESNVNEIIDELEEFKNYKEEIKEEIENNKIYDIEISTNEGEIYITWIIMW